MVFVKHELQEFDNNLACRTNENFDSEKTNKTENNFDENSEQITVGLNRLDDSEKVDIDPAILPDDTVTLGINLIDCLDSTTPDEITLDVKISSLNGSEELEPRTVVDTGAGRSYLLAPESKLKQLPLSPLKGKWTVQFADKNCQTVTHGLRAFVTVYGLNSDRYFRRECVLLALATRSDDENMQLLIGRDLIGGLSIQLDGVSKALIDGHVIFEAGNLVTSHFEDQVFMVHGSRKLVLNMDEIVNDNEMDVLFEQDDSHADETDNAVTVAPLSITFTPEPNTAPKGRPVIAIPWIGPERPSINFVSSFSRDKSTQKKLSVEERKLYQTAVNQLIDGGFAVRIPEEKPEGHFIAVRPVFKADRSTTKCRLCLDARAINKLTSCGPQTGIKMFDALALFRATLHVATFDLSKAFWQIKLQESEQQYFSTVVLGIRVKFTRMIFGGNFSPSGLETVIREVASRASKHLKEATLEPGEPPRPETCEFVNYVDDFHIGGPDVDSILKKVEWIRWFFNCHGFPSEKVRYTSMIRSEPRWEAYLSYRWNENCDELRAKECMLQSIPENEPCNRKRLVGIIMRLFDPMGFRLRLQLAGRMLIRECAEEQRNGDKSNPWKLAVSRELRTRVNDWIEVVNETQDSEQHKRFVDCSKLYCFCDASFTAWCCQIHGKELELFFAKGGLIKSGFTIPKAELTALHFGLLEIEKLPLDQLGTKSVIFITDNEPTVHRLRNSKLDRTLKTYELNRVRSIRKTMVKLRQKYDDKISLVIQHMDGKLNPADYATRPYPLLIERPVLDKQGIFKALNDPETKRYTGLENDLPSDGMMFMTLRSATRRARNEHVADLAAPPLDGGLPEEEPPPGEPPDQSVDIGISQEIIETEEDPALHRKQLLLQKILTNQASLEFNDATKDMYKNQDGLICNLSGRIVLNHLDKDFDSLKTELWNSAHLPQHCGINATKHSLRSYFWKNMTQDISEMVRNCQVCSLVRIPRIIRTAVGEVPWMKSLDTFGVGGIVGIDICEMDRVTMDDSKSKCGFMTTTCAVSKWIRASPVSDLTAAEACQVLKVQFEATLFPRVIISDGGSCFKARLFAEFCREHGILHLMSPHYSSPYNGWYERPHQSLLSQIRLLVVDHPNLAWPELLSTAVYLTNTRPYHLSDEAGLCPLHLVYGNSKVWSDIWEVEGADDAVREEIKNLGLSHLLRDLPAKYEKVGEELRHKRSSHIQKYLAIFEQKREQIRKRLLENIETNEDRNFPIGSWVRVYRPPSSKVALAYSEPRKIIEMPSQATRIVQKIDGKTQLEYIANLHPIKHEESLAPSVP